MYLTKILWLGYYRESRRLELQWGRHTFIAMKLYFWKSAKETTKTQNRITTITAFYCVGKSGRRRQWSRGENDQKTEVEISQTQIFNFISIHKTSLNPQPTCINLWSCGLQGSSSGLILLCWRPKWQKEVEMKIDNVPNFFNKQTSSKNLLSSNFYKSIRWKSLLDRGKDGAEGPLFSVFDAVPK